MIMSYPDKWMNLLLYHIIFIIILENPTTLTSYAIMDFMKKPQDPRTSAKPWCNLPKLCVTCQKKAPIWDNIRRVSILMSHVSSSKMCPHQRIHANICTAIHSFLVYAGCVYSNRLEGMLPKLKVFAVFTAPKSGS